MKRKSLVLLFAAAVFALLFFARFAYELGRPDASAGGAFFAPEQAFNAVQKAEVSSSVGRKNYASAKITVQQAAAPQTVEQKYERVSNIDSRTGDWDADVAALRKAIADMGALVQRENASGLPGSRYLALSLGVVPSVFDGAVEKLKTIGTLGSVNTVKTDRTADFRALEAKRLSLVKTRDGLAALRSSGAALADRVNLETRILEIEGQIQELGVSLGDFSELNSFCTVNIALRETAKRDAGRLVLSAAIEALSWTVPVYLGIIFSILCALGAASLGFWLYDRFRK